MSFHCCHLPFSPEYLKEGDYLKNPFCNSHDNKNTDEGADHQEEGAFELSFPEKETDDAP